MSFLFTVAFFLDRIVDLCIFLTALHCTQAGLWVSAASHSPAKTLCFGGVNLFLRGITEPEAHAGACEDGGGLSDGVFEHGVAAGHDR